MSPKEARRIARSTGKSVKYIDGRGHKRIALSGARTMLTLWDETEADRERADLLDCVNGWLRVDAERKVRAA